VIEKARVKMYKEEEAERTKIIADLIKIYEKTKDQDLKAQEQDRKISNLYEKVAKIRGR
jgi:adenylate cyclase